MTPDARAAEPVRPLWREVEADRSVTSPARRREPSSWILVAIVLVAVAGAAAVAIINLGARALQ